MISPTCFTTTDMTVTTETQDNRMEAKHPVGNVPAPSVRPSILTDGPLSIAYELYQPAPFQWVAMGTVYYRVGRSRTRHAGLLVGTGSTDVQAIAQLRQRLADLRLSMEMRFCMPWTLNASGLDADAADGTD